MKTSLYWLNSHLDRPADADEVERLLTDQGMPLDGRQDVPAARGEGSDVMLDVEVTSNRPDCLSHVGLAREVAAGSKRALRLPDCSVAESAERVQSLTSVENQDIESCPVYTARVIRGVKVGPSPGWLARRLEAIGLRSVNNVVDVTNFVMMELGQPLHAFDMARLVERRIVVRRARQGEEFRAIDGTAHKLRDTMLVIADAAKAVAVAGVMGGLESEVGLSTKDVLLEAARFAPLSIRRTSRALKLASDSSYRFERGIDPAGVETASRRAARLIAELAGGALAAGVVRAGLADPAPRVVTMRLARCRDNLGIDVPAPEQVDILQRLGLSPKLDDAQQTLTCAIPAFRLDLEREIDLIEEVARLAGVGRLPVRRRIEIVARNVQPQVEARKRLAQTLVAHGYHEIVTFSFLPTRLGEPFVPAGRQAVLVDDERRKAEPMLRPSLLPSLLSCRKANQDVGNVGVRLFETASVWHRDGKRIVESRRLALLCDAARADGAEAAIRDVRGTIAELAGQLAGGEAMECGPLEAPGFAAAATVSLKGQAIGCLGLIDAGLQALFDLQNPAVLAELELEPLLGAYPPAIQVRTLARFPGIERDLSVVVNEQVRWEQVRRVVAACEPAMMESLSFITTYRGKPVPAGKKSVSFRMFFRNAGGTLRHEQVDPQVSSVVEALRREVGAELRS